MEKDLDFNVDVQEAMSIGEAWDKVEKQEQEILSSYGKIRFNKNFFKVCTGVSLVSGIVGVGLLIGCGPYVAPILATGCGITGTVVGSIGIKAENEQRVLLDEALERNGRAREKIIEKSCKVR